MNITKIRIISAVSLLVVLVLFYLTLGLFGLGLSIVLISIIASYEFAKITFASSNGLIDYFTKALFILAILWIVIQDVIEPKFWFSFIIAIYVVHMLVFLFKVTKVGKLDKAVFDIMSFFFGVLYIGFPTYFFITILNGTDGLKWCFTLTCVTLMYDIMAYFSGIKWGKHKISMIISPNKSWEGLVGGLLGSMIAGVACFVGLGLQVEFWLFLLVCIMCGIVGQIGDLFESLIKRDARIKDSGRILPGHGGMLDRIDSLLLSIPVMFWLISSLHT